MPVAAKSYKSYLNGRHVLVAATLAAIGLGVVTGVQAHLARAGSANAVPLGFAVQTRTLAALAWVLVGVGVVAAGRRWPLTRATLNQTLPVHVAGALLAGLTVNLILHTLLWLLGADAVRGAELPGVIARDALDHAHLNALVYAALICGVRWAGGTAAAPEAPGAPAATYASRLTARRRETLTLVAVDDVDWIEGAGDYACLHVGARRHLTDDRLHALERILDPSRFVRVHRSALVNLSRVREVATGRWGDAVAVLRDGTRVRVSRTRREMLMSALRPRP
jgi:alkylhydroperoxidase/carboxymuconolactone decarboxylase family protein YurZ